MEKGINYLARDFNGIKSELIGFSKKYYPSISDSFNDSSIGAWFLDLVSAVGDDLNYYIDRCYQENNINSANQKSSLLNIARMNGVKVPGPKASVCEVRLSCVLPIDGTNISLPNWEYAPLVKRGSVVGSGSYRFELSEDVNFGEQFNSDGISNRTFEPKRNTNGVITGYTVSKSVMAVGGESRIYKKVMIDSEVEPFMEVVLPELNVLGVESIIFKETSNYDGSPQTFEFFIDEEEFMLTNESVTTYRYFEVDSLSDQYRFGTETQYASGNDGLVYVADEYKPQKYVDYTETSGESKRTTRYLKGVWRPITQKFMTEYTDNGFLKIIFGGATTTSIVGGRGETPYGEYITSKIINNDMLGVLPRVGWTMFVYYRVNSGQNTNLGVDSLTSVINANMVFPNVNATDNSVKSSISKSLSVRNTSPAVMGKDAPSAAELRYLIKYATNSSNRCVTIKDYKAKIMSIPYKFGCPFRCNVMEENNKVVVSTLGITSDGKLDTALPQTMVDNLKEYLSHYKSITDFVEIGSGKIYHLGFEVDVFIDKNYTTADVIASIINKISTYMDINAHDMGEDIFIGDLEKELNDIDGVISLIELRVYNIHNGMYSRDVIPMPKYTVPTTTCGVVESVPFVAQADGSESFRMALNETDNVIYSDFNSMFEILNPRQDIQIRAKIK